MTDEGTRAQGAMGPPWSVDLLADLQAGVLDETTSARLWPQVEADPEAQAILEALEATSSDLAAWGAAPAPPMPAEFATKLDQAMAQETARAFRQPVTPVLNSPSNPRPHLRETTPPGSTPMAPVIDIDAIRKRRNRRLSWGAGILAVAAAAIAAVAIVIPSGGGSGGPPVAEPTTGQESTAPLAIRADGSDVNIAQVIGATDYGSLKNAQQLAGCLSANGLDPSVKPVGVRSATVNGQPAVLVILTTGNLAQFRLIAFPSTCGPNAPGKLFDRIIGR